MSMYKLTRQETADKLNMSTRSVDRYIKAWKLRAKKDWKIVYINQNDIDNFLWNDNTKQEIIVEQKDINNNSNKQKDITINNQDLSENLSNIYKDLKEEIEKKDQIIQNLAMRVWKAEEVAKNSVSLLDFKKSQYLLEESKENISKELDELKKQKEKIETELKYEKNSNIILIIFVIILLIISWFIWFIQI